MKMFMVLISLLFGLSVAMPYDTIKADTIQTGIGEFKVNNYTSNGYDTVPVHMSTTYYKNGSEVGYSLIWGDTLSMLLVDSLIRNVSKDRIEISTWRAGEINNKYVLFSNVMKIDASSDDRNIVFIDESIDNNIVEFNTYECRVFNNRMVELYFLDGRKVYSVFTVIETETIETPKVPTAPISISDTVVTFG